MKIMQITMCTALGKVMASPQSYENDLSRWSKPKATSIAAHAMQQLANAFEADRATHESNLPAIENNLAIVERITALMDEIGMPKRWSERDSRSRSRYPKTISHDAGYLTDLRRDLSAAAPGASVDLSARDTTSDAQPRPDSQGRFDLHGRADEQSRGEPNGLPRPEDGTTHGAREPAPVAPVPAPRLSSSHPRIDVYA